MSSTDTAGMVIKLGPINAKSQYDYAIFTDPTANILSVQARDPIIFEKNYYDEVILAHTTYQCT